MDLEIMQTPIEISVCIVSYKDSDQLRLCLKSLAEQKSPPIFEVVLVSNNINDKRARDILEEFSHENCKNKHFLYNSENNIGQARALSVANSQGKYIIFTDPDCLLPINWMNLHKEQFLTAKKINSKVSSTGGSFSVPCENNFFLRLVSSLYRNSVAQLNSPQGLFPSKATYVDHVPTLNAFYERECILNIGNFDSAFNKVCEDVDLGYRLNNHGYKSQINPTPAVKHCIANSLTSWIKRCFKYGMGQSLVICRHKTASLRHLLIASYTALLGLSLAFYSEPFVLALWCIYFFLLVSKLFYDLVFRKIDLSLFFGLIPLILITHFTYSLGFVYGFCNYLTQFPWRTSYEYS